MPEVVPAIIAKNFEELERKVKLVEPYVNWVQLDVVDGKFAPEKSWPYICHPELVSGSRGNAQEMPKQVRHDDFIRDLDKQLDTSLNLEAHLMIAEPEKEIGEWIDSGVKRILVHYEAIFRNQESGIRNWGNILDKCAKGGVELGLVLKLETPIDVLDKICHCESADRRAKQSRGITARLLRRGVYTELSRSAPRNDVGVIDVVQLMSIARIGAYGEPFDERVIPKIRALRAKRPDVKISVDGGINLQNAKQAIEAGANVLVAGSAIFNSENIGETIKELKSININKN